MPEGAIVGELAALVAELRAVAESLRATACALASVTGQAREAPRDGGTRSAVEDERRALRRGQEGGLS